MVDEGSGKAFEPLSPTAPQFRTNIEADKVRIAGISVGEGPGTVYCYYFPFVRGACTWNALVPWLAIWPCKIGYTDHDLRECVAEQFVQTGVFEAPEVGFRIRTHDARAKESAIHKWFKERFERKRQQARKLGGPGLGREWFGTNLCEVRRAYREVTWPKWYRLPRRIFESWRMAYRVAQNLD